MMLPDLRLGSLPASPRHKVYVIGCDLAIAGVGALLAVHSADLPRVFARDGERLLYFGKRGSNTFLQSDQAD